MSSTIGRGAQFNPSFTQFKRAAGQAVKTGGAVRVNDQGQFVVKGKTWLGRKALWLKSRFMPGRMRAENQKVLHALARALKSRAGLKQQTIETQLRELGGRDVRRRDGNPFVFARAIQRAAGQMEIYLEGREAARPGRSLAPPSREALGHESAHRTSRRGKKSGPAHLITRSTLDAPKQGDKAPAAARLKLARAKLERQHGPIPQGPGGPDETPSEAPDGFEDRGVYKGVSEKPRLNEIPEE